MPTQSWKWAALCTLPLATIAASLIGANVFTITESKCNKDLPQGMSRSQARDHYRAMLGGFQSKLQEPKVSDFDGGRFIFRGDWSQTSLKGYGAEPLIAACQEETLVYCAPRVGMAMDAIATLAKMYGKRCVFFCPASSEASDHQKALLTYGAELRFIKIAAMPTLNSYAKKWAQSKGARYLPFGLANEALVTAGIVSLADRIVKQIQSEPTEVWMSVSTGTAIRALQIAWPNAEAKGIVVARNMQDGEIGQAKLWSSELPFLKDVKPEYRPHFPSTANYDAKCWFDFSEFAKPGAIFMNVGCDDKVKQQVRSLGNIRIDSQREWHDMKDMA